MTRLFDGEVDVASMQFYVETPGVVPGEDVGRRFAGQTNGLCGAAEAGSLHCVTGLHTGSVPVAVELLDAPPEDVDTGAGPARSPDTGTTPPAPRPTPRRPARRTTWPRTAP